jgi:hypothetical protein
MKIDKLFRTLNLGFCSLILLFVFNGCGMPIQTIAYDDVYATNLKEHEPFIAEDSDNAIYQDNSYVKKKQHYRELIKVEDSIAEQENFNAEELQTEYDVNYAEFDEEDYYDYAYSARLRRFYHPVVYRDYYADYYTNLYWYTYDPFCWGTSIYLGYSWWYPSYYSSLYWDPFYNPYWHHHHHHHHHHSHYDVCYFNSMDYNSNMYRGSSVGGSIKRAGNVSGSSIKKHITRNDNKTVKPSSNKKVVYTNNAKRYNKPANSTNRMKPGVNRGGKVSTINRQTNKNTNLFNRSNSRSSNSSKSYNRGSGSSINRSGGTRSSGSSFGGGSRGGSRSGGSIRR